MHAARTTLRSTQPLRARPLLSIRNVRNARFQSTTPSSSSEVKSSTNPALIGGLAGGFVAFSAGYAWYHFSGAKQIVSTSKQAKQYLNEGVSKLKDNTPEPNEALTYLRQTASSYAAFVPGAKSYVDAAFDELDAVRNKHGDEVDRIVREAYAELQDVAKGGASLETAQKAWTVLQKHLQRVGQLAGDAAGGIIDKHPELKEKVGGRLDQLKEMGEAYGPEAKKQVDQTWEQIQDIMKNGVGADTADKIRKVVQEKVEAVKKMGDEAWQKGLEQAKPYLDKSPKVKKVVEENADSLKQGNLQELWKKVREAVESGDTKKMEEFVKGQVDKAKQGASGMGGGGLEQYLNKIPGADQIAPKLGQLQEVAQKHGKEAEKLLKETVDEISQVLNKKSEEAKKLAEEAKKDGK